MNRLKASLSMFDELFGKRNQTLSRMKVIQQSDELLNSAYKKLQDAAKDVKALLELSEIVFDGDPLVSSTRRWFVKVPKVLAHLASELKRHQEAHRDAAFRAPTKPK